MMFLNSPFLPPGVYVFTEDTLEMKQENITAGSVLCLFYVYYQILFFSALNKVFTRRSRGGGMAWTPSLALFPGT